MTVPKILPVHHALLTEKEAAHILSVSPETLRRWRWAAVQQLDYIKVGHAVRYTTAAVTDFIERGTVVPGLAA